MPYPPANGKRFGWGSVIAGFIVGGVTAVVGGFFLLILIGIMVGDDFDTDPGSAITHGYVSSEAEVPEVGDCLVAGPHTAKVTGPTDVVDCDESHGSEVAAVVDVPGTKARPNPDDLAAFGEDACYLAFEEYVGIIWDDSELDYVVVLPDQEAWNRGDRSVWCLVDTSGGFGEDGTVRNSRR